MNWPNYFRQIWPFPGKRAAVLEGYRALGTVHRHTLTDIALRNNVFGPTPDGDAIALAIAEGRRRCAIEICRLANTDFHQLDQLIERKPTETRT